MGNLYNSRFMQTSQEQKPMLMLGLNDNTKF